MYWGKEMKRMSGLCSCEWNLCRWVKKLENAGFGYDIYLWSIVLQNAATQRVLVGIYFEIPRSTRYACLNECN